MQSHRRKTRTARWIGAAVFLWAAACAADGIKVQTVEEAGRTAVIADNTSIVPVQLELELTESSNIVSDKEWPISVIVPPRTQALVGQLYPAQADRAWSFRYRARWWLGDPLAHHDANAVYRLPFRDGLEFRVTQAPGGPITTHDADHSVYAVDIAMPSGTPIVAARSGYVMENIRKYGEGGPDERFRAKANLVRILHDDGTWAEYAHLLHDSANVYPGQRIEAGTQIGLSGNSGFSSGPHLHFVVKRNAGAQEVSVPFQFANRARGSFRPKHEELVASDYGTPPTRSAAIPVTPATGASGAR